METLVYMYDLLLSNNRHRRFFAQIAEKNLVKNSYNSLAKSTSFPLPTVKNS